ncbi:Solute carrier family 23 member 2 [Nymphon striatum]|nr:Solute carrier family 23 member 2 [Nymphon striatum]
MIGSVIGLPFILIPKLCMDFHEEAVGLFISNVMFVSGVVTFLQTTFGIRLPIAQGPALAFMAPTLAILDLKQWRCPSKETMQLYNITTEDLWKPRLLEVQGALIVSSLVQVFIGIFGISGFLVKFITPLTIVPTITLIGLSLFKVSTEISSLNWGISELTSILVIIMLLYLRNKKLPIPVYNRSESKWFIKWIPFFSFYAFSVAILIAWLVCHIFTITNLVPEGSSIRTDSSDAISRARWINIPYPGHVGMPTVSIYSTFGLISAVIAGIVKSIGDYYTCAKITGTDAPPKYAINRAVAMEGIGSIISGLCGPGIGVTSFTGNIGAIGLTKAASRRILQVAGLILMTIGIFTKLNSILVVIPKPIIGGILCIICAMITSVGLSTLQYVNLKCTRNLLILGLSLFIGISIPYWMNENLDATIIPSVPALDQMIRVFLSTNMFVGGFIGFFLDNTVPGTDEERGIITWNEYVETGKNSNNTSYYVPLTPKIFERLPFMKYFPLSSSYQ